MKAIVYEKYGTPDVLELREIDRPPVAAGDVLVRVHATCVSGGDWHMLCATWFLVRLYQGLFKPKRPVLGFDVSGTVEVVGRKVTRFQPGDEVFGASDAGGAFAEYMCVPEAGLAPKPSGLTHEQAAAVPTSAATALHGLRDQGKIQGGHRVLIHGASGGVGTYAVQIARSHGAEVTGVCRTEKLDLVRSLGADHVIDYRAEDFTRSDARYDLILDNVGNHSLAACKRTLRPDGIYVAVSGHPLRALWLAVAGGKRMVSFISRTDREDLRILTGLLDSGEVKPIVDRSYPLAEVPEAMRHFGEGRARGKIVIAVRDGD